MRGTVFDGFTLDPASTVVIAAPIATSVILSNMEKYDLRLNADTTPYTVHIINILLQSYLHTDRPLIDITIHFQRVTALLGCFTD